jgi:hypothetical protein
LFIYLLNHFREHVKEKISPQNGRRRKRVEGKWGVRRSVGVERKKNTLKLY